MLNKNERKEHIVEVQTAVRGLEVQPLAAARDIRDGLRLWRIWTALSWQEFKSIYRRSGLGVAWVIVSFSTFVFIKLAIFSSLLDVGTPGYYDSYLVLGFYVWFYLSQSVSSSPDTFVSNQTWIKSEPLPLSVYVFKNTLREFYSFVLTAVVVIAGIKFIGYPVSIGSIPMSMLSVPAFVLSVCSVKLLLGIVSARLRDISHLVKAIMLSMMFLTPIFWLPSQMGELMPYLWWNPFYHYIEIFRAPLLESKFPLESWIYVGCFYMAVTTLGFLLFARFRQRIVFWF